MGAAAQGHFEMQLGPIGLSASPANRRLVKALEYSERIIEFVHGCKEDTHLHVALMHAMELTRSGGGQCCGHRVLCVTTRGNCGQEA